jgi:hypothetical protein
MSLKLRSKRTASWLLGAVALGGILGAAAAVVYVSVDRLDIVDKKRAVAKTVVTVDRNAALNVIAKEGRWYKVEVGGKEGYVAETVVANKQTGKKGQSVSLNAIGDGSVPALETAAAVKGVGPGAQQYASGKGLRTDGLIALQARREGVTPAEFEKFLAEGPTSTAAGARAAVDRE